MKVIHVESGRHLYGGALQVKFLLDGLRALAGEHVLVCPRSSEIARVCEGVGHQVRAIPMSGEIDLRMLTRLRGVLKSERADLVHAHSRRGADIWSGLAARTLGVPAVVTRRVDNPEQAWVVRAKYGLYRRVITISQGILDVLASEGVPRAKLRCVPSAVDTDRYRPGGNRDWLRQEFGLADAAPIIGMIAQLIPRKGHRVLIEAIPDVLTRYPRCRFLLFGKGAEERALRQLVEATGLGKHVIFTGFRDDLDRLIPALDLVVHPAFMEGLGVSLLQAAASAVPIVATRVGGIPEIVRHEDNGLLVEPGDVSGLAKAIACVLAQPQLAEKMGRRGREIAVTDFSIDAMVTANYRVYRETLAELP